MSARETATELLCAALEGGAIRLREPGAAVDARADARAIAQAYRTLVKALRRGCGEGAEGREGGSEGEGAEALSFRAEGRGPGANALGGSGACAAMLSDPCRERDRAARSAPTATSHA
jgi:hypothetical protein